MLAGASAFVLKPVKGDELIATVRKVLGRAAAAPAPPVSREAPLGRVVVFCAPKGGTGRTTLAINTGISLRDTSHDSVVIVDADYAAPAIDVALNLKNQRDIRDLLPKLNRLDNDLVSSVLALHSSGVRVLLAPPPDVLEYPPTLPQVQQVTATLKRMFRWVLVDLGLPLDEAAYAFLDAADVVVMSILPEMVGMRNGKFMLAQFDQRHYPAGKVWPLLNREGLPGGVKKPEVITYLGRDLMFAIPNDQELATETINRGVPMVVAHRRRPVAQAYRKLAVMLGDDRKLANHPALPVAAAAVTGAAVAAAGAPTAVAPTDVAPAAAGLDAGEGGADDVDEQASAPSAGDAATGSTGVSAGLPLAMAGASATGAGALGDAQVATASAGRLVATPSRRDRWARRGPLPRSVYIAGLVALMVLLAALVGVIIGKVAAGGGASPGASTGASTYPPDSTQVAAIVDTPTASPTPADHATHEASATRVGEILARVLGPLPGTTTSEPGGPPGATTSRDWA